MIAENLDATARGTATAGHTRAAASRGVAFSLRKRDQESGRGDSFLRGQRANLFLKVRNMPTRVPRETKLLRGTARKDRDIAPEPQARLTTPPRPPASMPAAARAEWRSIAPMLVKMGVLRVADLRSLRLLCATLADADAFAAIVAREGVTVPAGSGSVKTHPAVQALATARAQARGLLADFGLTPRARESVAAAPGGTDAQNPYARWPRP